MAGEMTRDECLARSAACGERTREMLDTRLKGIEATQERIEGKIDQFLERVHELEVWKGRLNGAAAEAAFHAHNRDLEAEAHVHRRKSDDWRVRVMWGLGLFAGGAVLTPILSAVGAMIVKRLFP